MGHLDGCGPTASLPFSAAWSEPEGPAGRDAHFAPFLQRGHAATAPGATRGNAVGEHVSAEERVMSARQWALALRPSKGRGPYFGLEDARLVLPPLPALKEYVPGSAGHYSARSHEGVTTAAASAGGFEQTASEEPYCFQPPKFSTLGAHAPRGWADEKPNVITGVSERAATAVWTMQVAEDSRRAQRQAAETKRCARGTSPPRELREATQRSQPPVRRTLTVVRTEERVVRGKDPMAGGLFSRDAQLNAVTTKKGVYEAQLRGNFAAV